MNPLDTSTLNLTLLYHYFHPDDVVSARLFSDIAEGLTARGWDVTAMPCHRGCRDESITYPLSETWPGGLIDRVWRPNLKQSSGKGRILNAAWMLAGWSWRAFTMPRHKNEVMVVGTDPILSVLVALPWKFFRPEAKIVHWCHDLYPEAAVAEGMVKERSFPVRALKSLLAQAYRKCGLIADLGSCMAKLLKQYGSHAKTATLTPWALVEPPEVTLPDPAVRANLFGPYAGLGLLYSGTFGRAHTYEEFLTLARLLRNSHVKFCFAGRGNRTDELRKAITPDDTNVSFAGFAPEAELEQRLTACDLHLVSLRPEWTGTVVPSKFFGALAAGRGVLFAGSPESAIAQWVREYDVGWVLTPDNLPQVAEELRALSLNPSALAALRERCFATYRTHFSKQHQLDLWDAELRGLLI
jgi:glycosyltransferase involved in cell wall biosynthesis